MGGVSKGGFTRSGDETLIFKGELSLENNGGFASIRTKPSALNLSGMTTLIVKAKGDGRTYWLDVRVANQMAASSYRAFFPTTAGEWKETSVPLSDFKLQAFGRELPAKDLDPAAIASVGFTLADKKPGPFLLEIESIKASCAAKSVADPCDAPRTIVDVAGAAGTFKTLLAAATAAELAGVLSGPGPFTVFAPTDEAFAKLPAGTLDNLLEPGNREQLAGLLKNHIVAGKVSLAKALEAREAATLQGAKVTIKFDGGRVQVNEAGLIKADLPASNGIIHVIDRVLIPSSSPEGPVSPVAFIELSIKRGVPLFNKGDVAACAALYEITCEGLRGMSQVTDESRKEIGRALKTARTEESKRRQAWILREALDDAWALLNKQGQS